MNKKIEKLRQWGCDVDSAMRRMLNDEDFYFECLEMIPNDENLYNLENALNEKDTTKAFYCAHTLKGVLANMDLTPMLKKIEEIVEPLRAGNCENLMEKYKELVELNEYLKKILE